MRQAKITNEELVFSAAAYRKNAAENSAMTWPENSEQYRATQIAIAEVHEELLDWRLAAG